VIEFAPVSVEVLFCDCIVAENAGLQFQKVMQNPNPPVNPDEMNLMLKLRVLNACVNVVVGMVAIVTEDEPEPVAVVVGTVEVERAVVVVVGYGTVVKTVEVIVMGVGE